MTSEASSVRRFDLAIQRNHVLVFTLGFLTGLAGGLVGVFPLNWRWGLLIWAAGCASSGLFYFLFRKGIDRRVLNPFWLTVDVVLVTLGVYATAGVESPWFIWYMAASTVAAFAIGKTAAHLVSLGNTIAYIGILLIMGQVAFWNDAMMLALCRMLFVWGASYFFLIGVANLQEKRLRIKQLEAEATKRVEELTRVTQELADANRRTREADRLKSQFLANMSHELRTPMNSIIGFSEILVERLGDQVEPKHLGFLKHIHASGQHLLAIINDILDLSKIEAGKMEVYPEFFPIAPVVESVCQVMRGMSKSNLNFVTDIPPDLPQIETDLAKFKQVLFNLLSNATKFSPPNAPVTISARLEEGSITVTVRDEGIGIDPMHHAMIFEEFRQVDATVRREFGGTGLGLALVRRFVEIQGGRVSVDSRLGEGSMFSFTLPVRSRAAVVARTQETAATQARGERVLVVEDDANAYDLIANALGSAGYLSIRARHGDEALKLARESKPVAVTLDLILPGLDGWEVLKRLKGDKDTCQIPVVIISMIDNRDLGIALGADDYFVKPVDRDRLLERLRTITSHNHNGHPARILVIDDDAAVHSLLDAHLTALGYSVACTYSGAEGLAAAQQSTFDVIILDLMMPGLTGFDVADSLKNDPRTANVPILVLTSKEISSDDRKLLHKKVSSFVQKGNSSREQLVREIRRVTQSGH